MPDPYFDPDQAYAGDYLPSSALSDSDIDFYVRQAERDVIQHFTRSTLATPMMPTSAFRGEPGTEHLLGPDTGRKVYLRYYKEDAADIDESDADEAAFLEAMRATIAEVALHRMDTQDQVAGVKREERGEREIEYWGDRTRFPANAFRHLKPFDIRLPSTYI